MPENSERKQYHRLLEMFPANSLKQWIGHKGSRASCIEAVLEKKTHADIREFVVTTFSECKQHVFSFSTKSKKAGELNPLTDLQSVWHQDIRIPEVATRHHIFKTSQIFIDSDGNSVNLTFLWPVKVIVSSERVTIHAVILERSTNSVHLDEAVRRVRTHRDKDVLSFVTCELLAQGIEIVPLDINRGVKHMWEHEIIDSTRAQAKGSKSTHIENMDAGHYLKRDLPTEYTGIVRKPLYKTIFHVLKDEPRYGRKFIAEPTMGCISFCSRSNPGQIDNVLNYILGHN